MIPIPIRRLCAACGSAFTRLPGQPVASFVRRLRCQPCAAESLPEPIFTASSADAPPAPLPLLRGVLPAL